MCVYVCMCVSLSLSPFVRADQPPKQFSFNYAFWSHNPSDSHYVDQEGVFQTLGMDVLEAAWEGYNSTLFAYGQSGSGKTYSMTGGKDEHRGMIPRVSVSSAPVGVLESGNRDRRL